MTRQALSVLALVAMVLAVSALLLPFGSQSAGAQAPMCPTGYEYVGSVHGVAWCSHMNGGSEATSPDTGGSDSPLGGTTHVSNSFRRAQNNQSNQSNTVDYEPGEYVQLGSKRLYVSDGHHHCGANNGNSYIYNGSVYYQDPLQCSLPPTRLGSASDEQFQGVWRVARDRNEGMVVVGLLIDSNGNYTIEDGYYVGDRKVLAPVCVYVNAGVHPTDGPYAAGSYADHAECGVSPGPLRLPALGDEDGDGQPDRYPSEYIPDTHHGETVRVVYRYISVLFSREDVRSVPFDPGPALILDNTFPEEGGDTNPQPVTCWDREYKSGDVSQADIDTYEEHGSDAGSNPYWYWHHPQIQDANGNWIDDPDAEPRWRHRYTEQEYTLVQVPC